jgi:hypothetical protein
MMPGGEKFVQSSGTFRGHYGARKPDGVEAMGLGAGSDFCL